MTKYEWTKAQIESVLAEYPSDDRTYVDAFLAAVKKAGEDLTRSRFFELMDAHRPDGDLEVELDYFTYGFLDDQFCAADFSAAWNIPPTRHLPPVSAACESNGAKLPDGFCRLGGKPEWIQNECVPICRECDANMALLVQITSKDLDTSAFPDLRGYMYFDAGNVYVFTCPDCGTHEVVADCY